MAVGSGVAGAGGGSAVGACVGSLVGMLVSGGGAGGPPYFGALHPAGASRRGHGQSEEHRCRRALDAAALVAQAVAAVRAVNLFHVSVLMTARTCDERNHGHMVAWVTDERQHPALATSPSWMCSRPASRFVGLMFLPSTYTGYPHRALGWRHEVFTMAEIQVLSPETGNPVYSIDSDATVYRWEPGDAPTPMSPHASPYAPYGRFEFGYNHLFMVEEQALEDLTALRNGQGYFQGSVVLALRHHRSAHGAVRGIGAARRSEVQHDGARLGAKGRPDLGGEVGAPYRPAMRVFWLLTALCAGCAPPAPGANEPDRHLDGGCTERHRGRCSTTGISRRAASDEERYFAHFADDAVFMGTDATERWDKAAFRAYAHPHFAKGKGLEVRAHAPQHHGWKARWLGSMKISLHPTWARRAGAAYCAKSRTGRGASCTTTWRSPCRTERFDAVRGVLEDRMEGITGAVVLTGAPPEMEVPTWRLRAHFCKDTKTRHDAVLVGAADEELGGSPLANVVVRLPLGAAAGQAPGTRELRDHRAARLSLSAAHDRTDGRARNSKSKTAIRSCTT